MKPRKIIMQAFGAYLEKTEVDFTPLFESNLFLITGPTGCGKTSILDAMSFALYGRATGSVRDVRDMRNTASPQAIDTFVSFEFELDKKCYKFDRLIHIHERKLRDGGKEYDTTNEASCFEFDGSDWHLINSNTNGVREKAEQLLGFSYEQFSQVVVLPQGEFRKLLTASSSEKQKILEVLFGMQRWQLFIKALSEKSKILETKMKELTLKKETILTSADAQNIDELTQKQEISVSELETVKTDLIRLNIEQNEISVLYNNAVKTTEQFAEQEQCSNSLTLLLAQGDENKNLVERLKLAQKADKLMPFVRADMQSSTVLQLSTEKLLMAQAEQKNAQLVLEQAQQSAKELQSLDNTLTKLTTEAERLDAMHSIAENIYTVLLEKKSMESIFITVENKYTVQYAQLETFKKQQIDVAENISEIIKLYVMPFSQLTQRKNELQIIIQLKTEFEKLQLDELSLKDKREKKLESYKNAELKLKAAKSSLELMEQAEKQDKAWHLALSLEDGKPCPVCGATTHPEVAMPQSGVPDKATMEAQQNIIKELEESFDAIKTDGTEIRTKLDNTVNQLAQIALKISEHSEIKLETAKVELVLVENQIKESILKQKKQQNLEKETDLLKTQISQIENELCEVILQKNELQSQVSLLDGKLQQLYSGSTEEMRDVQAINSRITQVKIENEKTRTAITQITNNLQTSQTRNATAQAELIAAQETHTTAINRKAQTSAELEKAADDYELDKNINIKTIILTQAEQETISFQIETYNRELHSKKLRLDQLNQILNGINKPDIESLQAKMEQIKANVQQIAAQEGSLEFKILTLKKASTEIQSIAEETVKTKQQYEISYKMFKLVNGENTLKTPIHQFVLGLMLDDILSSANQHLSKLSRGQYTLIRNEEIQRGGGTKGLDLSVNDAWSGGARSVNTLSGGEMFLASLSLAFGLADVVQSYSGGIRLDSIFIDEGFGSLDNETLEIAMQALQYIRSAGRLIGIISHVNELKERIPSRIEVSKSSDGTSSVKVLIG